MVHSAKEADPQCDFNITSLQTAGYKAIIILLIPSSWVWWRLETTEKSRIKLTTGLVRWWRHPDPDEEDLGHAFMRRSMWISRNFPRIHMVPNMCTHYWKNPTHCILWPGKIYCMHCHSVENTISVNSQPPGVSNMRSKTMGLHKESRTIRTNISNSCGSENIPPVYTWLSLSAENDKGRAEQ